MLFKNASLCILQSFVYIVYLVTVCLFSSFLVTLNLEVRKPHALQTLIQIQHKCVAFLQSSSLDVFSKISLPKVKPELCIQHGTGCKDCLCMIIQMYPHSHKGTLRIHPLSPSLLCCKWHFLLTISTLFSQPCLSMKTQVPGRELL